MNQSNDVLVLTLPLGTNYGGMLQAYALKTNLKELGFTAYTTASGDSFLKGLIRNTPGVTKILERVKGIKYQTPEEYELITKNTRFFLEKNMNLISFNQIKNRSFYAYISGSDQTFRSTYSNVEHSLFDFVKDKNAIKFTYAASFGRDDLSEYSPRLITKTAKLAKRMNAISVREKSGMTLTKEHWDTASQHHVDPTLLLPKEEYSRLIENCPLHLKENTGGVFEYVLDNAEDKIAIRSKILKMTGLESFTVINSDLNLGQAMPPVEQWLKAFQDADFVVTDSFHGTVFSIIFNKPFLAIGNKSRGLARFTSLLELFNLENRLISTADDVSESLIKEQIDWQSVNERISAEKQRSRSYLQDNLSGLSIK